MLKIDIEFQLEMNSSTEVTDVNIDKTLYTYGIEQQIEKDEYVQIFFMFWHPAKRLIVMNLHKDGEYSNVRAFAIPFNTTQNVNTIMAPYLNQIAGGFTSIDHTAIGATWKWLSTAITTYYEGDMETAKWFNVEEEGDHIFNADEMQGLAQFDVYPQQFSEEYIESFQ